MGRAARPNGIRGGAAVWPAGVWESARVALVAGELRARGLIAPTSLLAATVEATIVGELLQRPTLAVARAERSAAALARAMRRLFDHPCEHDACPHLTGAERRLLTRFYRRHGIEPPRAHPSWRRRSETGSPRTITASRHGTVARYTHRTRPCRCDDCRRANRDHKRRHRAAQKGEPEWT